MANKVSTEETKNISVYVPTRVHTQAKTTAAALGLTWDEAVAVALGTWALANVKAVTDVAKGGEVTTRDKVAAALAARGLRFAEEDEEGGRCVTVSVDIGSRVVTLTKIWATDLPEPVRDGGTK